VHQPAWRGLPLGHAVVVFAPQLCGRSQRERGQLGHEGFHTASIGVSVG
jgi:hypothetical protein